MLLGAWGTDLGGPPDLDGDGTVGILDLLTLLGNWGGVSLTGRCQSMAYIEPRLQGARLVLSNPVYDRFAPKNPRQNAKKRDRMPLPHRESFVGQLRHDPLWFLARADG